MKTRPSLPFLSRGLLPMSCAAALMLTLPPLSQGQKPPPLPTNKVADPADGNPYGGEAQKEETRFDLDFPGGSIQDFVTVVEASMKEPFNVIIPENGQDLKIQPVKVKQVQLSSLLQALSNSSKVTKIVLNGKQFVDQFSSVPKVERTETGFSFVKTDDSSGPGVWQLIVQDGIKLPDPPPAPPAVRFYALKPLLESGLKLEDLTTAVETAWSLIKVEEPAIPQLKFHEETKLLIAVGPADSVKVIDDVLQKLAQSQPSGPDPFAEDLKAKAKEAERRAKEAENRAEDMERQMKQEMRKMEREQHRQQQEATRELQRNHPGRPGAPAQPAAPGRPAAPARPGAPALPATPMPPVPSRPLDTPPPPAPFGAPTAPEPVAPPVPPGVSAAGAEAVA